MSSAISARKRALPVGRVVLWLACALFCAHAGALPLNGEGAKLRLPDAARTQPWRIEQLPRGPVLQLYHVRLPRPAEASEPWWQGRLPQGWQVTRLGQFRWWLAPLRAAPEEGWLAQWLASREGVELWLSRLLRRARLAPAHPGAHRGDGLSVLSDWRVTTPGQQTRHRILHHPTWRQEQLVRHLAARWQTLGWRRQGSLLQAEHAAPVSTQQASWQRDGVRRQLLSVPAAQGVSALVLDDSSSEDEVRHD